MEDLFPYFARLLHGDGFFRFENEVAQALYGALGQGYANHDNEVSLVTRMVAAVDGMSHGGISLHARKIHGTRSYVEFNHQDRPITKELGDSVFITVVTRNRQRLVQRVCFVQNKVAKGGAWHLDLGQLFLLKNFPLISGRRGLFRGASDIVFKNLGKTLGAFGLFCDPGEMLLLSAPLVADLSRGASTLKADAISVPDVASSVGADGGHHGGLASLLWPAGIDSPDGEMFFHEMHRFFRRLGPMPFGPWLGGVVPFLARATCMRDLHEVARNWLLANVGEYSFAFGRVPDPALDRFAASLLRAAGMGDRFEIGGDTPPHEGELAILVAHVDVGEG